MNEIKQINEIEQLGTIAQVKPDGIMTLAEEAISKLISLTESLNELEKIISPVMSLEPSENSSAKEKSSPAEDRPDSRLKIINKKLSDKIDHVKRLSRCVNI